MLRWFGRHIRASNAVVAVTAAALLLCTATSFGLAATVFEHDLGLHHDHDLVGHLDHEHDAHHGHDNNTGDPPGGPDEIATHHVHVFAMVQPVASLPWIPGRRLVREFAYSRLEQGCLHRLERIPKHLPT